MVTSSPETRERTNLSGNISFSEKEKKEKGEEILSGHCGGTDM